MNKPSTRQLKNIRNMICVAGIVVGFILWKFLPDTFQNTRLFHIGNGESGSKTGALILLLIQFIAFIPDTNKPEIHTEDPGELVQLEAEHGRKEALRQVYTAIGLALTIWAIMGFAALML
jgi:hypothetical protein